MATAADRSKAAGAALIRGCDPTAVSRVCETCMGLALVADAASLLLQCRKERVRAEKRHVEQGRSARPFISAQERENEAFEALRHALGRATWVSGADLLDDLAKIDRTREAIP